MKVARQSKRKEGRGGTDTTSGTSYTLLIQTVIHGHPLQLCCPDVFSLIGEPLTGRRVWFTELRLISVILFLLYDLFIFYS